jgi:hypothetical protein
MQAELTERDLSYQVTTQVGKETKGNVYDVSLVPNAKPADKMGEVELEQFVRSISALGDCV